MTAKKQQSLRDRPGGYIFFAKNYKKTLNNTILSVRWNSRDLLNTLSQLMDWDLSKGGYRIPGTFYQEDNVILFDLKESIIIK